MRSARALVLVGFTLALSLSPAAGADPRDVADRASRQVMSPFCDGLTLHDCPSQESVELRSEILEMARRGMTAGAIVDELVARYGERVRGVPKPEGTDLLVWVIPGLAAFGALAAAVVLIRRFSARSLAQPQSTPTAEEQARLNAELGAFRSRM